MSTDSLTQADLKKWFHYDPLTGIFTRRECRGRGAAGSVAGRPDKDGYLRVRIGRHYYSLHRLAFLYMTGRMPAGVVDHEDHCTANNRFKNLRDVSQLKNTQNHKPSARKTKGRTSSFLGVWLCSKTGKWVAQIRINGRLKTLGRFIEEAAAGQAYVDAKKIYHVAS